MVLNTGYFYQTSRFPKCETLLMNPRCNCSGVGNPCYPRLGRMKTLERDMILSSFCQISLFILSFPSLSLAVILYIKLMANLRFLHINERIMDMMMLAFTPVKLKIRIKAKELHHPNLTYFLYV